jgi:hypothetical protein
MKLTSLALCLGLFVCGQAMASQTLFVYPAGGQSDAQLAKDRYQCYRWAVDQTGVDPGQIQPPKAGPTVVRNNHYGAEKKGTWMGVLAGAAIGNAVDGHLHGTVEGALIGASLGKIIGGGKERKGEQQAYRQANARAQRQAQAKYSYQDKIRDYNRAFSACMEARDYTVR